MRLEIENMRYWIQPDGQISPSPIDALKRDSSHTKIDSFAKARLSNDIPSLLKCHTNDCLNISLSYRKSMKALKTANLSLRERLFKQSQETHALRNIIINFRSLRDSQTKRLLHKLSQRLCIVNENNPIDSPIIEKNGVDDYKIIEATKDLLLFSLLRDRKETLDSIARLTDNFADLSNHFHYEILTRPEEKLEWEKKEITLETQIHDLALQNEAWHGKFDKERRTNEKLLFLLRLNQNYSDGCTYLEKKLHRSSDIKNEIFDSFETDSRISKDRCNIHNMSPSNINGNSKINYNSDGGNVNEHRSPISQYYSNHENDNYEKNTLIYSYIETITPNNFIVNKLKSNEIKEKNYITDTQINVVCSGFECEPHVEVMDKGLQNHEDANIIRNGINKDFDLMISDLNKLSKNIMFSK
ncbi:unnamed protein product [Gordionus sp. m RMFG-2023]